MATLEKPQASIPVLKSSDTVWLKKPSAAISVLANPNTVWLRKPSAAIVVLQKKPVESGNTKVHNLQGGFVTFPRDGELNTLVHGLGASFVTKRGPSSTKVFKIGAAFITQEGDSPQPPVTKRRVVITFM